MRRLAIRTIRWVCFAAILTVTVAGIAGVWSSKKTRRDGPFAPVALTLLLAMCPVAVARWPHRYAKRMHGALAELARTTGGRASWTGLLDPDLDLTWSRGCVRAHLRAWIDGLTSRGKYNRPPASARYHFRYTLELPPQSMKLRLEVRPETVLEAVAKMFGMQDLSLGQPELDRQLIVQASDQAEYNRCLDRGLGGRLGELLRLSSDMSLAHVSFVPGRLVVQRSRVLLRDEAHEERAVRELHDVTLALAATITGLDVEVLLRSEAVAEVTVLTSVPEGAACLVCGGTIDHAPVVCTRCETPHHRDCWDYNGACALYACGSREARRAQRVAAAT